MELSYGDAPLDRMILTYLAKQTVNVTSAIGARHNQPHTQNNVIDYIQRLS